MKKYIFLLVVVLVWLLQSEVVSAQSTYCCKLDIMCRNLRDTQAVFNRSEFVVASDDARCSAMSNRTGGWGTGCYALVNQKSGSNKTKAKDPATGNDECLLTSEMYQSGTCIWTLANNCGDIDSSLSLQTDETKCAGDKPNGTTAKCCCPIDQSSTAYQGNRALVAPSLYNALSCDSIPCVIGSIISKFLTILGAIALLVFIYGGFRWLTAAGNDQSIATGKETLVWATIGIIFIFLSYILVGFVLQSLGV